MLNSGGLLHAVRRNDMLHLKMLLEHKADPNQHYSQYDDPDISILEVAISEYRADAVKLLLQYGADPNTIRCNDRIYNVITCGSAPGLIRYAAMRDNTEMVKHFLDHGAREADIGALPSGEVELYLRQRHCKKACIALYVMLQKRAHLPKDVIRYVVSPMVWASHGREEWVFSTTKKPSRFK